MHVLLIHQAFAALDEPGGTRHHELARYLVEQGHQVTVIASPVSYLTGVKAPTAPRSAPQGGAQAGGVQILRAYTYPALHRSFVHRVFSFVSFMAASFWLGLQVPHVDLVWGTSPPIFQGLTAWALARLKRVSFLFEVRDLWPAFAIGVGVLRNPLLIRLSEGLERFLYRHADQVMVNSPGFIDHVQARGARQVALIPNGADPRMFDPDSDGAAFRQAHGLTGKFVALYAGAHGLSNDLGIVLEAADRLRAIARERLPDLQSDRVGDRFAVRPEIEIVLLGDGKDKPALIARAAALGLSNVLFLPPVPKTEMAQALAAADACIAILKPIALYTTVYPNKVFDYLAAGRPVVLAIGGVIRAVVEEAGAGIPVQPGDPAALAGALQTLADDPELGRLMGRRGRHYVETHFDRALLAKQLEQLMLKLSRIT